MDVIFRLRRCLSQRGSLPLTAAGLLLLLWLLLRLRLTSTTCFYDLCLQPASTACLYCLRSASTACLRHAIVIIVIINVHFLFKRNIYFSLLYVIYVFFLLSFLEIIFLFFF
jgi:hypothetical protein